MSHTGCLEHRFDEIEGLRIFTRYQAQSAPEGSLPLVLVHGLGVSSAYLEPAACDLAADFPVYAPDLPGYGRSQHPPKTYDLTENARALCAWMDALGIRRANLLGNSMGCQVIIRFALLYPRRLNRLVLDSPTMDPAHGGIVRQLLYAAVDLLFEPLSLFPILLRDYLRAGPKEVFQAMQFGLEEPMLEDLPKVQAPTLVMRGSNDAIVSQRWAEQVARLLPDARLEVIPAGAHAANFDAPQALSQRVRSFLLE